MTNPNPDQVSRDHLYAFSCAANLLLYDEDPGPRAEAVGGPNELRVMDRRERLVGIYARMLLLELEASVDRLVAVTAEAQRRLSDDQNADSEAAAAELVTVELAQTAAEIIREAGAADDPISRERLLAATNYQTSRDVFGAFLGDPDLAGPPDDLIANLKHLDRKERGS